MNAQNKNIRQGNIKVTRADGTPNAQFQLAKDLLGEVAEVNGDYANQVWAELKAAWAVNECTYAFVSARITSMIEVKKLADQTGTDTAITPVPDGRYALLDDAEADLVRFYRVASKDGKYFVWAYKSDEQVPLRNLRNIKAVLAEIAEAGFEASQVLFGQKSHRCYKCGRRLTDATSRSIGLGPDCAAK